jgi:FlaA1/EpsC-like NDP-sugar epimerase
MLCLASLLVASGTIASLCLGGVFSVLVLVLLHVRRVSRNRWRSSVIAVVGALPGPVSLAAMLTISGDSILGGNRSVSSVLRVWMFAIILLSVARVALWWMERRVGGGRRSVSRTLIVGAGVVGHHVVRRLRQDTNLGFFPLGFLDADPMAYLDPSGEPLAPLLGGPDDLADVVERTGARHVILAFTSAPDQLLVELTRRCRELGLGVSVVPRFYEGISGRDALDFIGGLPLLTLDPISPNGWQFALKHVVDRLVASLLLLLIAAPMMLGIAAAVWLGSPGPVLFRQRRVAGGGCERPRLMSFRSCLTFYAAR